MEVFLRFDALPDDEFRGEVTRIDPYVDTATRTSAVEIELDNEAIGNRLRPGMFGQASIVEREFRDAILLPESALNSGSDGYYAFIEEDGVAKRRDVETGLRQGNYMQITSGITPGDRVIVFGGSNLNDGDRVEAQ
jgi:RND family efflux transporter MFP subunit